MIEIKGIKIFPDCRYLQPTSSMFKNIRTYDDCRKCPRFETCSNYNQAYEKKEEVPTSDGESLDLEQRALMKQLAWLQLHSIYGAHPVVPPQLLEKIPVINKSIRGDRLNLDISMQPGPRTKQKLSSVYGVMGRKVPDFDGDMFRVSTDYPGIMGSEYDGGKPSSQEDRNSTKRTILDDFEGDLMAVVPIDNPSPEDRIGITNPMGCYYLALMYWDDDSCKQLLKIPENGFDIHEASDVIHAFENNITNRDRELLTEDVMTKILVRFRSLVIGSLRE